MDNNKKYLFLVVVGGRAPKANIELHDVRWVIGSTIEETFDDLRKSWFGSIKGLHIDSYKKISSVDGFKINLKNTNNQNKHSNKEKYLRKTEIAPIRFLAISSEFTFCAILLPVRSP